MNTMDLSKPHYDISEINRMAKEDPAALVALGEEKYRQNLYHAALEIKKRIGKVNFVMIAGPTASGKTTTARKLKHQLEEIGIGAVVISLDDFFIGAEAPTRFADGRSDYESIFSLDIECMHRCFFNLISHSQAWFPIFDFGTGMRSPEARHVRISQNDVVIVEGLHALNPVLLPPMEQERLFRIYVSVKSRFVIGNQVLIGQENTRLIRRMVRDYHFRNTPPDKTLEDWRDICHASQLYIEPFEKTADLTIDTAIMYEPSLFGRELAPLLQGHHQDHEEKVARIESAIAAFLPVSPQLVPADSLLREFIGGE
ncbi:uridine kinase family protein [Zongyangia hominis]|uniref:Phosphoribulokinase/uridine kinase domain-containing protein n=1 Tax=Zongyangia hominis TaxID=2763677 RepID=A0A926E9I3_9FIRM|nr:hypothetical protein [Zongyangia hominis]MBC8569812.1 hypothetical protein [Zongyangia hominis]